MENGNDKKKVLFSAEIETEQDVEMSLISEHFQKHSKHPLCIVFVVFFLFSELRLTAVAFCFISVVKFVLKSFNTHQPRALPTQNQHPTQHSLQLVSVVILSFI